MRLPILATACLAILFAASTTAQVQVFGGSTQRHATSQVLFGDGLMAGIAIEHGQPVWKDKYDGMLDQLKGKLNRLGSNWWTTMTTSVDIELGGAEVPAGSYLLGLHCSKDGKFGLAFLEATKGMKQGAVPFPMNGGMNWKPDFIAPLTFHKGVIKGVVKKLELALKVKGDDLANGSFALSWGTHQLRAKLAVIPGGHKHGKD